MCLLTYEDDASGFVKWAHFCQKIVQLRDHLPNKQNWQINRFQLLAYIRTLPWLRQQKQVTVLFVQDLSYAVNKVYKVLYKNDVKLYKTF